MPRVPDEWLVAAHFGAGGVAGMTARTVIAPIELVKINFQTRSAAGQSGWIALLSKVFHEGGGGLKGVKAFWKGNTVAVIRVFPYLGVQLSTNEYFRRMLRPMGPNIESVNFFAGGAAGAMAVFTTYPLDLARARLALLYQQGVTNQSMYGIMKEVYVKDGLRALWTGAGISMTGAGVYCGIKFASYDVCKDICRRHLLPDPEGKPTAFHRAVSGGLAGCIAQTFVYPVDVIRRRLQTGGSEAKRKYPGFVSGLLRLYRDEGFTRGLYRGLSLNYIKTVPNTTVYLALFDYLRDIIDS